MKYLYLTIIFITVCFAHIYALDTKINKEQIKVKTKKQVNNIQVRYFVKKEEVIKKPLLKTEPLKPKKTVKKKKTKKKIKKKRHIKKPLKRKVVKKRKKTIRPEKKLPLKNTKIVKKSKPIVKPVKVDTKGIKNKYLSKIRSEIQQNLIYPSIAKRMRLQGIVNVSFRVLENGKYIKIKILNNPKSILKKAAVKTIRNMKKLPIPQELKVEFFDVNIPIIFNLNKG